MRMTKKRERYSNQDQWNAAFKKGGQWETSHGRRQTRLFAEAFCRHTSIHLENGQSLLDSSCALGDALPVFRKHFLKAQLYACDFSKVAIRRCKERHSGMAGCYAASIEEISSMYDVIYSSATLEHFADYKEKARTLLQQCKFLCIFVPYNEKRFGKDLEYDQYNDHVVTFREHSFDFLLDEGFAKRISYTKSICVPKAWSWTLRTRITQTVLNVCRLLLGRPIVRNPKMILFEIERKQAIRNSL